MNIQSEQTETDITKPNRLAIASLLMGILLLCPVIIGVAMFWRGFLWDQKIIALLFVFLEGIGLIYGTINVIKGNETTRRIAEILFKNFRMGAMAGSILGLILIIISQVVALRKYWSIGLLIIAIPGAIITGLPTGGIGGLILGSVWKNKWAAIIGGIVAWIIIAPALFRMFSSCGLLGGC